MKLTNRTRLLITLLFTPSLLNAAASEDPGLSTWLTVRATPSTDFQIGYSRSVAYHLDSLFFGVGFHIGHRSSVIN